MNARNEENLKALFERFVSTEEAERNIEDFIKAERILNENPAPEPNEELIAAINHKITEALRLRKEHSFRRIAYKLAPVAAVFVVLAAVGVQMLLREGGGPGEPGREPRGPFIPASVWESENVAADDRNLLVLTTELDELEVEFANLESDENGGNGSSAITELEIEFAEINRNIWEG
jgi:hypothetical protein